MTSGPDVDLGDEVMVVENLRKSFRATGRGFALRPRRVEAVKGVSFALRRNRVTALVGESGSGKTTTARMLLRLETPDSGQIRHESVDISRTSQRALRRTFRRSVQAIFQDPAASLNPRKSVGHILAEAIAFHQGTRRAAVRDAAAELLESVGLAPSREFLDRSPHELSGGQQQRVAIARALSAAPSLIVADEPVSALDLSVRAQVLGVLAERQASSGMSVLLITHDLAVVRAIANDLLVMYRGEIVERGEVDEVFSNPTSEYTCTLLEATPRLAPKY